MRSPSVAMVAVALSALVAGPARASGQSNSGSTSSSGDSSGSKDSNSSNGSKDSSNSSGNSSHNSQGSSKDSDNSTQNSPKNSSDWTTHHSSDWTTHSHDAHVLSIALVVVAVGATVAGTLAVNATQKQQQQRAALALAEFMRRQHPLIAHDVVLGEGPVLAAWEHDLRLDAAERTALRRALDGSPEQALLLDALDGPIDQARAGRFAAAFVRAARRALGPARTDVLIRNAVRAVGVG